MTAVMVAAMIVPIASACWLRWDYAQWEKEKAAEEKAARKTARSAARQACMTREVRATDTDLDKVD